MRISILLLFAFLISVQAWAGGSSTAGDGGYGVECVTPTSKKIHLLDLYEAKTYFGWDADVPLKLTLPTKIDKIEDWVIWQDNSYNFVRDRAAAVLGRYHPFLESLSNVAEIEASLSSVNSEKFFSTRDYGLLFSSLAKNCDLVQIARRIDGIYQSRFYNLNMLAQADRQALVVHEALHTWFHDEEESDLIVRPLMAGMGGDWSKTMAVRQAVMYLFAPEWFRRANAEQFKKIVERKDMIDMREFKRW